MMDYQESLLADFYKRRFLRTTEDIRDYLKSLPTASCFKEVEGKSLTYSVVVLISIESSVRITSDGRDFIVKALKR